MNASNNSATIRIQSGEIIYSEGNKTLWCLPLSSVEIVGEYTTPNGSYIDDYFLVFITQPNKQHFHASFYAEGRNIVLNNLSQCFGNTIECGLSNSTQFASRCMWPPRLAGQKLFNFSPLPVLGWKRIFSFIFAPERAFDFSKPVENHLAAKLHE